MASVARTSTQNSAPRSARFRYTCPSPGTRNASTPASTGFAIAVELATALSESATPILLLLEERSQPFAGAAELLGNQAHIPEHAHEVGVPRPARNQMKMIMPRHPSPGGPPQVESQIQAIGMVSGPEQTLKPQNQRPEFEARRLIALLRRRQVSVRRHHQVTRAIGVAVEQHEVML